MKQPEHILRCLLAAILIFISSAGLYAQHKVNLSLKNADLKTVLSLVTEQTGYKFAYSQAFIKTNSIYSVDYHSPNASINNVLDAIFKGHNIQYNIKGKQVVLASNTIALKDKQEKMTIHGTILSEKGEPLAGTVIQNKTNGKNAVADIDGNFSIEAKEGDHLFFALMGMLDTQYTVGKKSEISIQMKEDAVLLNDVVVTGYQTISKERSAGSYVVISSDKIENKLHTNIMDRLEGMVSGMQMYKGKPIIRGTATLLANDKPLYVVDGVPFEGDIDMINPNEIVNVSVLKDATAASIYGARSTNGVIVITTRSGQSGKLHVNYGGTVSLQGLPDRDYLNQISSSEFVDFQEYLFNNGAKSGFQLGQRTGINDVYRLLLEKENGTISADELKAGLDTYRHLDNKDQIRNYLNKVSLTHQHNLSFNGGSDFYKYSFSINYTGSSPYEKEQYTDRLGFNIKNNFNFTKWFQADVSLMGNVIDDTYSNGSSLYNTYLGKGNQASYDMLEDAQGNPLSWEMFKSREEIERLNGLGLMDETYYPLLERNRTKHFVQSHYLTFNLGAKFNILESLNIELRYQTEIGSSYTKTFWDKDSYKAKNLINNAASVKDTKTIYHIPVGGQAHETNSRTKAYTLRAQINYNDTFAEDHQLTVLAGAERRKITANSSDLYRYGYDDENLSYGYLLDEAEMRGQGLPGTQGLDNRFKLNETPFNISNDDRYVSFYANASYTWKQRLNLSASIRMDQSNLFGTNPKYQYKPLWSAGASYIIFKEGDKNWIDRLSVRATYGINGNVYKKGGPYIISKVASTPDWSTGDKYARIITPPNEDLRWEKTKTLNLGVNFGFLNNRLNGSIEYYNKNTVDMISERNTDPTVGWEKLVENYASMYNRGVEFTLESVNINSKNFTWGTSFMFSYNKNKISSLKTSGAYASSYYYVPQAREGQPFNSLYSVKYAGLDEAGNPQAYKKDGTTINGAYALEPADLVCSGTIDPPYNAAMTNTFSFKGFDLSFMFIYYGGHVMRDIAAGNTFEQILYNNPDKTSLNMHGSPWDEQNIYTLPAFKLNAGWNSRDLWSTADIHIQHADYIKLRDISLAYNFPARLTKKMCMQGLRLTFQVNDIWTWASNKNGLDPEVWEGAYTYPYINRGVKVPTSYVIGLNIKF